MSTLRHVCRDLGAAAVLPVAELRTPPIAASLSFKTRHDDAVQTVEWDTAKGVATCSLAPWRTFRWWYGQRHYSGTYWSATMQDHVIYESRLELTRLIYADFDPAVTFIVAQPFLIEADMEGKRRRRIPDYLLLTSTGPVVVDVKPLARTTSPKVTYSLTWTRELIQELGWRYEVWTEPPPIELANRRFLAGYRDERRMNAGVLEQLRNSQIDGLSIQQAILSCDEWPQPLARAGVCHLLWCGSLHTDLSTPLQSSSILRKGPNS
nr:TnsA-like heteromeric transposase endonuclease subunit [Mycolicibacterium lacusdiani]